ncbi:hypothetical protein Mapa_015670 [Marchantia paleacea]|nr:hypothetical protein Mapa_015670 [Marchantia paleacea]
MASRIEELEKAVDDVLREVTADEDGVLPSPSSSPIRKPLTAPASPDIRKLMSGSGSFSGVPNSPSTARYGSSGTPDIRRQVSAAAALGTPKSPDPRRHSAQGLYVPNSPDPRRHSATGIFGPLSQTVGNSTDVRRQTLPGNYVPTSPDVRKNPGAGVTNVPSSPDPRRRTDTYATGMR